MDDSKRIATIREGSDFGDTTPAIKYNLDDHLGSSNVLVDENGTLVNFEEYYPFGETSFGAYSKKRYRFCGKEKDEESGMYYYGARYYSPWLCRFISVDPIAGKYVFQTPYAYADNNPINKMDYNGEGTGEGEGGTNPTPASEASNPPVNIIFNAGEKPIEPKAPENNLDQLKDNFEKDKSFSNYEKYEQGKKDWENYNQQKAEYDKNLAEYNENKKFLEGVKNEILNSNDPVLSKQRDELKGKTITIEVSDYITNKLGERLGAGTFTDPETGEVTIKFDRKLLSSGITTDVTGALNTLPSSHYIQTDIIGTIVHELGHVIFNSQSSVYNQERSELAAQRWEAYYYRQKYGLWIGITNEKFKHIDIRINSYERFKKGF